MLIAAVEVWLVELHHQPAGGVEWKTHLVVEPQQIIGAGDEQLGLGGLTGGGHGFGQRSALGHGRFGMRWLAARHRLVAPSGLVTRTPERGRLPRAGVLVGAMSKPFLDADTCFGKKDSGFTAGVFTAVAILPAKAFPGHTALLRPRVVIELGGHGLPEGV